LVVGLYYYNARWYDPELGRFITEDPAKDGLNWYTYVRNNPLKYTDPTGMWVQALPQLVDLGKALLYSTAVTSAVVLLNEVWDDVKDTLDYAFNMDGEAEEPKSEGEEQSEPAPEETKENEGSKRHTPDQEAVIEIAQEGVENGGVSEEDAETLVEWGKEAGFNNARGPEVHPNRPGIGKEPHIHIGPIRHLPVK